MMLLVIVVGFIAYKIFIKRYNKKHRPYLIEDEAINIINLAEDPVLNQALRTVYKKKKYSKIISKFNSFLAKEIYLIKKNSEVKEK